MKYLRKKLWVLGWHFWFFYFLTFKFQSFSHWKYYVGTYQWVESYRREKRKSIKQEALADAWWCL